MPKLMNSKAAPLLVFRRLWSHSRPVSYQDKEGRDVVCGRIDEARKYAMLDGRRIRVVFIN